ncbi:hypothetical protein [Henriciella litoralis]|uniref:hypothetical protein n=1 Tax=Henriciella litoralis TaxID=568102 RepID=UPI0009FDDBFC|nr:hypothetical protein [Henriciella litoralis]
MRLQTASSFVGRSGKPVTFTHEDSLMAWTSRTGIALLVASDAYGWRVVRIVDLRGQEGALDAAWAMMDARRYGASAVFVRDEADADVRQALIADLEAGLSPVLKSMCLRPTAAPVNLAAA